LSRICERQSVRRRNVPAWHGLPSPRRRRPEFIFHGAATKSSAARSIYNHSDALRSRQCRPAIEAPAFPRAPQLPQAGASHFAAMSAAPARGMEHRARSCTRRKQFHLAMEGRESESTEMKPSITSVVGAFLLAGTFTAHAQNSELGVPTIETPSTKAPSTQQPGPNRRTRSKEQTDRAPSAIDSVGADPDSSLPRIPSVIRNCEEPAPRFCRDLP
jgi:hypothetical protein